MKLLNGGALPTLQRCRDEYPAGATHLGRLVRPRHCSDVRETLDAGFPVGVDNEAFSAWDQSLFITMLACLETALYGRAVRMSERFAPIAAGLGLDMTQVGLPATPTLPPWHKNLLFVTVPDVPFDAKATERLWSEWAPLMSHLPLALCIQDGAGDVGIPWHFPNLRALFMAGSTSYTLSDEMAAICREGKRRGLHIHAGRVNTRKRIRHMLSLDFVDSIDGSGFDTWRDTHLGWGLDEVSKQKYQLALTPDTAPTAETQFCANALMFS
jgi:hypothetical protein